MGHSQKKEDRKANCPAYNTKCGKCSRIGHLETLCRTRPENIGKVNSLEEVTDEDAEMAMFFEIVRENVPEVGIFSHHVKSHGMWKPKDVQSHKTLKVHIKTDEEGKDQFGEEI